MSREQNLALPTLYRGLYSRIAAQLQVHPSYVSRVASGERRSEKVTKALKKELQRIARSHR